MYKKIIQPTTGKNPAKFIVKSKLFKEVNADFNGGTITSDAGAIILEQIDENLGLSRKLALYIKDKRQQAKVKHSVEEMLRQRIFQISCGYEDLNDANTLKNDPVLKMINGRNPETDDALASPSTLCRFENAPSSGELLNMGKIFIQLFIEQRINKPPRKIILDFDATEDPTHGQQYFSFYNGYFMTHCFFPMIVTARCDDEEYFEPLAAVLRPGNSHPAAGTLTIIKCIHTLIRKSFPDTEIVFRGDAGFASPEIYEWLETNKLAYVIGFPKNNKVMEITKSVLDKAKELFSQTNEKVRIFDEFNYKAGTWGKYRKMVIKAEVLKKGENPRFLVTNLKETPEDIYDKIYARRGDMENRIKELKEDLKMDRTSCHGFLANQLRLILTLAAYKLYVETRKHLQGTQLEKAQTGTIMKKLIKIGARARETCRRVWIHFSGSFPLQDIFVNLLERLKVESAIDSC